MATTTGLAGSLTLINVKVRPDSPPSPASWRPSRSRSLNTVPLIRTRKKKMLSWITSAPESRRMRSASVRSFSSAERSDAENGRAMFGLR